MKTRFPRKALVGLAAVASLVALAAGPAGATETFDVTAGSVVVTTGAGTFEFDVGSDGATPCVPSPANPDPAQVGVTFSPNSAGTADATTTIDWVDFGKAFTYLPSLDGKPAGWYQLDFSVANSGNYTWVDNTGVYDQQSGSSGTLTQNAGIVVEISYQGKFFTGSPAVEITQEYLDANPTFEPTTPCGEKDLKCEAVFLFGQAGYSPLTGTYNGATGTASLAGSSEMLVSGDCNTELAFALNGSSVAISNLVIDK